MARRVLGHALVAAFAVMVPTVRADVVTGFVNDPMNNSGDFSTAATGLTIDKNVNFSTHPLGPLQDGFYTASDGVTFSTTGPAPTVVNNAGPSGSAFITPDSNGEGTLPNPSNYLYEDGSSAAKLTLNFTTSVRGVGLFTIDLFNPSGANPVTIQAFSGQNGTGTALDSPFTAAQFNFQPNKLYFMGLIDSTGSNIGSVVFTDPAGANDAIGIGPIYIARDSPPAVPEPSALVMAGVTALGGTGYAWKRRRAAT